HYMTSLPKLLIFPNVIIFCAFSSISCATAWQEPDRDVFAVSPISASAEIPPAERDVNVQIVDALQQRYGDHPGFRSNHAKGIVVEGSFVPTPAAAALSRSPIFAGATIPTTVRFSDAGGIPHQHDAG